MTLTSTLDPHDHAAARDAARASPAAADPQAACDPVGAATRTTASEWLSFRVGPAVYGVDLLKVREIRSDVSPMRIAQAPVAYAGLMDLRGDIVPVFDLRHLLDADAAGHPICVVMALAERVVGILVDRVDDVVALAAAQIRPVPYRLGGNTDGHLIGIGVRSADDGTDADTDGAAKNLQLLDVERLLAASRLIAA